MDWLGSGTKKTAPGKKTRKRDKISKHARDKLKNGTRDKKKRHQCVCVLVCLLCVCVCVLGCVSAVCVCCARTPRPSAEPLSLPPADRSAGPPFRPKFRAFCSFFQPHFHSFFLSLGVFSWNFGGVLVGRDSNVLVFAIRLSCGTPAVCAFEVPTDQNTTKIPREDPQREKKKRKWEWKKEQKARIFGPPTMRGPHLRGPTLRGQTFVAPPFGAPPFLGLHTPSPLPPALSDPCFFCPVCHSLFPNVFFFYFVTRVFAYFVPFPFFFWSRCVFFVPPTQARQSASLGVFLSVRKMRWMFLGPVGWFWFPNTPHTQLDSLSAPGGAVQFDLRSDTESVLSGPEVFGESVHDEVWLVAGTEEVVSESRGQGFSFGTSATAGSILGSRPVECGGDFQVCNEGCPTFSEGSHRNAMRVVLEEACAESHARQGRGWKLFMMLPSLHRPPRGGLVSRDKLVRRFDMFSRGETDLQAAVGCRRRRRRPGDDLERRAARVEMLVHWESFPLPDTRIPSLKHHVPVLHLNWMNIAFSKTSVRHGGGQQEVLRG